MDLFLGATSAQIHGANPPTQLSLCPSADEFWVKVEWHARDYGTEDEDPFDVKIYDGTTFIDKKENLSDDGPWVCYFQVSESNDPGVFTVGAHQIKAEAIRTTSGDWIWDTDDGDPAVMLYLTQVTISAFDRVPPGKEKIIQVTVSPSGATIDLDVVRTAGFTGSATVSPSSITVTTNVTVTGGDQTNVWNANNLSLRAKAGDNVCASEAFSVCAHPNNFRGNGYWELDPVAGNYYGLIAWYLWDSDSSSLSHLDRCRMYEFNHTFTEDRPPFYAGSAPPNFSPFYMNSGAAGDVHGAHKDYIYNYQDGYARYNNDYLYQCERCTTIGYPSYNSVSHHVYNKAASPPPNDWWIETDKIHTCSCSNLGVDQDIP